MSELKGRINIVSIVEVEHANPNGDPGANNRPRQTYEGYGEISDVCIKRKARNRFQEMGEHIFVQAADRVDDGFTSLKARADKTIKAKDREEFIKEACEKYFDVRLFGQVFAFKGDDVSVGIRGAATIQPAFSLNEIEIETSQITKSVNSEDKKNGKASDTMGEKHRVKYGIYVVKISINARPALKNGVTEEDVEKFIEAVNTLFIDDDSSARPAGSMNIIKTYVFKHNKLDGQYSDKKVFDSIKIDTDEVTGRINKIEYNELKDLHVEEY